MSDITLNYRSAELLAPAKTGSVVAPGPLGLCATLAWSLAAYAAMWSLELIEWMLQTMWGADVSLPRLLTLLPTDRIAAAAVVVIALWCHGRAIREYLALVPIGWGGVARGLGYGVAGFIGMAIIYWVIELLQTHFGVAPSTSPTIVKLPSDMDTMIRLASLWLGSVVAAPIVEEMLFRGLMYRGLAESRIHAVAAIVLTSVAFGLAHYPGFGWPRVIATGCMGLFLAWQRWHYGNTSIGMVTHAANNAVAASILTFIMLS